MYVKYTTMKHTKSRLKKLIFCVKEKLRNPVKTREKHNYSYAECMMPIHGGDSVQYEPQWGDPLNNLKCNLKLLTKQETRFVALTALVQLSLGRDFFSRARKATMLNVTTKTIDRTYHSAPSSLLWKLSGKRKHRTNMQFVNRQLFTKTGRKQLRKLFKTIWNLALDELKEQCPTIYNKIVNIYNKLIKEPNKTVQSSPKSETIHFSRRERGKVRVSVSEYNKRDHKRVAYSVHSMSKPHKDAMLNKKETAVKLVTDFEIENTKKKEKMSSDSLRILVDQENETMNKHNRMARSGPRRMCGPEFQDLKRSIAYHYNGGYVHQLGDRIFSKEHTSFLRKKYNL